VAARGRRRSLLGAGDHTRDSGPSRLAHLLELGGDPRHGGWRGGRPTRRLPRFATADGEQSSARPARPLSQAPRADARRPGAGTSGECRRSNRRLGAPVPPREAASSWTDPTLGFAGRADPSPGAGAQAPRRYAVLASALMDSCSEMSCWAVPPSVIATSTMPERRTAASAARFSEPPPTATTPSSHVGSASAPPPWRPTRRPIFARASGPDRTGRRPARPGWRPCARWRRTACASASGIVPHSGRSRPSVAFCVGRWRKRGGPEIPVLMRLLEPPS
jgi:hypothetical protein